MAVPVMSDGLKIPRRDGTCIRKSTGPLVSAFKHGAGQCYENALGMRLVDYVDGDIGNCYFCTNDVTSPAWDGDFGRGVATGANRCNWSRAASPTMRINGKRFRAATIELLDFNNSNIPFDDGAGWVGSQWRHGSLYQMIIACNPAYGYSNGWIWYGYLRYWCPWWAEGIYEVFRPGPAGGAYHCNMDVTAMAVEHYD